MPEIKLIIASNQDEISKVHEIRKSVFVIEQGIPLELDLDEIDDESIHVLAVSEGEDYVGTGRLNINNYKGAISRIAIVTSYRGKGIGQLIIKELEKIALEKSVELLELKPHYYLEKFYNNLGYTKSKEEEIVANHRLITMAKKL